MDKVKPDSQELLDRLRKGETVICPSCKKGTLKPAGNPAITCYFGCEVCKKGININ